MRLPIIESLLGQNGGSDDGRSRLERAHFVTRLLYQTFREFTHVNFSRALLNNIGNNLVLHKRYTTIISEELNLQRSH